MAILTALLAHWEWAVPCIFVMAALWGKRFGFVSCAAVTVVGLMWLALYCWTGDRRLYFPYTMQFAIQLGEIWKSRVPRAGALVVACFTLIRIWQGATTQVLEVELAVAVVILIAAGWMLGREPRGWTAVTMTAAVASLFAFISLAL